MTYRFLFVILVVAVVNLVSGPMRSDGVAAARVTGPAVQVPGSGGMGGDWAHLFDLDSPHSPAVSDADRGCCVWKSSPTKCAFTNRGYCKTKAGQSGIAFEFYEDTNCSAVSACPSSQSSSNSFLSSLLSKSRR